MTLPRPKNPGIRVFSGRQNHISEDEIGSPPKNTLPETNSSPLKIGRDPKRKRSSSNHPFSGAMLVSGRVCSIGMGQRILRVIYI